MNNIIKSAPIIVLLYMFALSGALYGCKPSVDVHFTNPSIKLGNVQLSGRITTETPTNRPIRMRVDVRHPITLENSSKEFVTDSLGYYSIEIELETNPAIGTLSIDIEPYKTIYIELVQSQNPQMNIHYTKNGEVIITKHYDGELTENDMLTGMDLFDKVLNYHSPEENLDLYNKHTDTFLQYYSDMIDWRLEHFVTQDTLISELFKKHLSNEVQLLFGTTAIAYKDMMEMNYRNVHHIPLPDTLNIAEPSLQYYSFLKRLNLNSDLQLNSYVFRNLQEYILQNDTLAIPSIRDAPIPSWQAAVKERIADLIGFSEGQYYDVLTANAYALQLNMEVIPLSPAQKENIHAYFKGGEIEKILLRQNKKTEERVAIMEPLKILDSAGLDAEHLLADIVEKNKGKIVIVDFWATWCAPCIAAMKEMKSLELSIDKDDIAHVYLTNGSSPKGLWSNRIKEMGGQHYYLSPELWLQMMDKFGFEAIPSYVILDRNGEVKHHFTGYPGNIKMTEIMSVF